MLVHDCRSGRSVLFSARAPESCRQSDGVADRPLGREPCLVHSRVHHLICFQDAENHPESRLADRLDSRMPPPPPGPWPALLGSGCAGLRQI